MVPLFPGTPVTDLVPLPEIEISLHVSDVLQLYVKDVSVLLFNVKDGVELKYLAIPSRFHVVPLVCTVPVKIAALSSHHWDPIDPSLLWFNVKLPSTLPCLTGNWPYDQDFLSAKW